MRNVRKYIAVFLFFMGCPGATMFGNELFDRANQAYNEKNYPLAITLYDSLAHTACTDAVVFYNLGNAYYKNDQLAESLLWYERALRLDPANEDIKYNINFVNQQTIDKMEIQPEFFLKTWISAVRGLFSAKIWSIISIVLGVILCGSIALMLIFSSAGWRKGMFSVACISFVFLGLSIVFAALQTQNANRTDEAILIRKIITVKSTPDTSGTDLFTVHEGLKVQITDRVGSWVEVRFANGNKGWITEESVEVI